MKYHIEFDLEIDDNAIGEDDLVLGVQDWVEEECYIDNIEIISEMEEDA